MYIFTYSQPCRQMEAADSFTFCALYLRRKHFRFPLCKMLVGGFSGLKVACWSLVPKFAGSNLTEAVGFFRAKKILSTPSFGGEIKPSVPCRRFTALKRSLNVTWKSGVFRQNSSAISCPCSSTSLEDDQWRKLEHSKIRRFINISTSGRQDLIEGDQQ